MDGETGGVPPVGKDGGREGFASGKAAAEGGDIAARGAGIFQDLTVERRHRGEVRCV